MILVEVFMKVLTVDYQSNNPARTFCESLESTGFAVLNNHPIPPKLIHDTYNEWAEFFRGEEKHQYTFDAETQAGYFPFRSENAKDSPIKDLKEFFHIYPRTRLPRSLEKNSLELYERLIQLGSEMLSWLQNSAPAAVLAPLTEPLPSMVEGSQENLLRIIHYPPLNGQEESGAIRAAAHEDINLITLLCSATAAGLEVLDKNGNWHAVPTVMDSITINAGDMLQKATHGYFKSTTHRVVNPVGSQLGTSRYSMPLFLHPRAEVRLTPDTTARQYLDQRLREIGLKK